MAQTQRGIDYGLGKTNIDRETGIRYGVISQGSLAGWFFDEYEAQYGAASCPKCGEVAVESAALSAAAVAMTEDYDSGLGCADYTCHACKYVFDSLEAFPEEPIGYELKDGEYHAIDCLDSDVMVLASPYYTYAPYCSPCVPGAGNLDDAVLALTAEDVVDELVTVRGVRTYCFGHEYFEDGKAPYRVFRVSDGSEVLAGS